MWIYNMSKRDKRDKRERAIAMKNDIAEEYLEFTKGKKCRIDKGV